MTRPAFEKLIARAVESLPPPFKAKLGGLIIQAADSPTRADLHEAGITDPDDTLYGLFQGVPLPDRHLDDLPDEPDRILIFQRPLEEDFGEDETLLVEEIRTTLLHELGHYFGLSEDELDRLGYG